MELKFNLYYIYLFKNLYISDIYFVTFQKILKRFKKSERKQVKN